MFLVFAEGKLGAFGISHWKMLVGEALTLCEAFNKLNPSSWLHLKK